ncbi:MAG: hypothetical protein WCT07_00420 [Candidatus Paceibacterota bacterium]|jgi:hypothetical protein
MQFLIDIILILIYLVGFFLLCAWAWRFWKMYVNQKFLQKFNDDSIMLEIKLPREITKSPLATEIAIASLLQGGGISTWYAREFQGNLPLYASLEIASLEGVIHFYVRINKKFKSLVESNFYAQYPGIEIVEADDYTKKIRYHHLSKDVSVWGINYRLGEKWSPTDPKTGKPYQKKDGNYKMPADFFPIKTYVDYGLDKESKEELKTDPITPLLEFMGSIGKGEYYWYQILIQDESVYNKKMPKFYVNEVTHEHLSLSEMADARKKQIRSTISGLKHGDIVYDDYGYEKTRKVPDGVDENGKVKFKEIPLTHNLKDSKGNILPPKSVSKKEIELTPEEKEQLEAINKKLSKPLACVVVRIIYVAKKENSSRFGEHVQNTLSYPKSYAGVNSLSPVSVTDPYDYPWEKMGGKRPAWRAEEKFEEYVEREGFFPHIPQRAALDSWEDLFFWGSSMKTRKTFRMIYEAIFYPFNHPKPEHVSILNLEEIASLWHLPGAVAGVPTLPRIDSNKGVAPVNLPQ